MEGLSVTEVAEVLFGAINGIRSVENNKIKTAMRGFKIVGRRKKSANLRIHYNYSTHKHNSQPENEQKVWTIAHVVQ